MAKELSVPKLKSKIKLLEKKNEKSQGLIIELTNTNKNVLLEKQKYKLIFDNAGEGIVILDMQGRIIDTNPVFSKIIELDKKKIIGKKLEEFIENFEINTEVIVSSFESETYGGELKKIEYKITNKKDEERTLLAKTSFVNDEGRVKGFMVIVSDITEYKEMGKLKTEAETQKKLSELRQNLTMTITHELKQPLTPIMGYIDLIKAELKKPSLIDYAERINKNAERMQELINRILTLFKLETGKLQYKMAEQELSPVIEESLNIKSSTIDLKKIKLTKKLAKVKFKFDYERIKDILVNLLDNAVKFSKKGGKIEVKTRVSGRKVYISVKDHGTGIKKEDLPELLKEFYQTAEGKSAGGTGIGISLIKMIVKGHKGGIDIKSVYGKGTEFIIMLPK